MIDPVCVSRITQTTGEVMRGTEQRFFAILDCLLPNTARGNDMKKKLSTPTATDHLYDYTTVRSSLNRSRSKLVVKEISCTP